MVSVKHHVYLLTLCFDPWLPLFAFGAVIFLSDKGKQLQKCPLQVDGTLYLLAVLNLPAK